MKIIKLKELINDKYDDGFWDNKVVELKKWNLDDILTLNIIEGATPAYRLVDAGFIPEEKIDVKILFGDYSEEDVKITDDSRSVPGTPSKGKRDLRLVKDKLEKILEKLDYKNRELIIFRTFKGGYPTNWDSICVFSENLEEVR